MASNPIEAKNAQVLMLVNERDEFLGYENRGYCHNGLGKQHRAFVTLLFDKSDKVLLQKRKHALFDGFWDFTAISHPLHVIDHDETYQEASDRALMKEFAIPHVPVKNIGGFTYFAQDGEHCENEYCAVLIGHYDGAYQANPDEVYEDKKMAYADFIADVKAQPGIYTPWAVLGVKILDERSRG